MCILSDFDKCCGIILHKLSYACRILLRIEMVMLRGAVVNGVVEEATQLKTVGLATLV